MAKAPASEQIMSPAKLKPLLTLSKREPVQAAIALTTDGDGLILLDKKAKPRKVMSLLRGEAAKAKLQLNGATIRFGRAEVDPDYDPATVRFFINKEAPGNMRTKLVEVLKRSAFQKVEFNVDPALDEEPEDEAATQEAEPATAPAQDAAPTAPETPVLETAPAPAKPAETPGATEAEVRASLTALVKDIPAGMDAARKATLLKVAGMANDQLKAGHAAAAAATLVKLREAMGHSDGPAMKAWQAERATAIAALRQLSAEITKSEDPEADPAIILVQAIIKNLGARPDTQNAVTELENYIAKDDIIDDAESPNPFGIEVKLRAPLLPALAALRAEHKAAGR